jgi:hypothetical protein
LDVFSEIDKDAKVDCFWHANHLQHWYGYRDELSTFATHHWSVLLPTWSTLTGVVSGQKQIHSHASLHWRKNARTRWVKASDVRATAHDALHQFEGKIGACCACRRQAWACARQSKVKRSKS